MHASYYRPWTSLRRSAGPLLGLGISIPGPMTGLGQLVLDLPPGVTLPANGNRLAYTQNGRDFGAELRARRGEISARLIDREPIWREMYPPIEDEVVAVPVPVSVPWGKYLLYGGLAVGALLIGRRLLRGKK